MGDLESLYLNFTLILGYFIYTYYDCYCLVVDYQNQHYPNRLKIIRQNAGYTQQKVAELLGHNNAVSLCDWENEKTMPNGTNLMKLCTLYNKTPQELYPEYHKRIAKRFLHL
jgi:DNA-binding XRE family transcriptional regulator